MEERIKVAVMGLPRPGAWVMAEAIANSQDMELVPVSLTAPETLVDDVTVGGVPIRLFTPEKRQSMLFGVNPHVVIDCMSPKEVQNNVGFYNKNKLPFVVGTVTRKSFFTKPYLVEETFKIIRSLPKKETKNENLPRDWDWYDILAGREKDFNFNTSILREKEKALQRANAHSKKFNVR